MTAETNQKAKILIQSNLAYLDEVIESAIINLLENEGIESDNDFIVELQQIYETYIRGEKYGKTTV